MYCTSVQTLHSQLKSKGSFRWSLGKVRMDFRLHRSIKEIDQVTWDKVNSDKNIFLSFSYLKALSEALSEKDEFRFITFSRDNQIKGIAVFHITHFETSDISSNIEDSHSMVSFFRRSISNGNRRYHVLICGNAFSTGESGYSFSGDVGTTEAMTSLCYALTDVLRIEQTTGTKISAVVVKDFYSGRFDDAISLQACGFRSFEVDHNMVMPILPEWKSREDYLAALNTKFRTKANAALKRSAVLESIDLDAKSMLAYGEDIRTLYEEVYAKADFRMGKMSFDAFYRLKLNLGEKMVVRLYMYDSKPVGFLSGMETNGKLDAHLVGLKYHLNSELAIYSRILYDYIEIAIHRGLGVVLFGRTAGEIKSSVGAFPVDMKCCIRHPGRVSNLLMSWLFAYIKPSEYPLRNPYKKTTLDRIKALNSLVH